MSYVLVWLGFTVTAVLSGVGGYYLGLSAGSRIHAHLTEDPVTPNLKGRRLSGHGWQWLIIGLLVVAMGALGLIDQRRYSDQQQCLSDYLNGAAHYSSAVQETTQALWDDFKSSQKLDPKDKQAAADAKTEFFADLDAERAAAQALASYRATHVPKEACPL